MPRLPGKAASASLIAVAPAAVVAVPTTRKPFCASVVAIARPMPREAPVTRATCAAAGGGGGAHPSSARAAVKDAGSCTATDSEPASIRRVRLESTLPGPHSKMSVTPRARIARIVSSQRTGP